MDFTIFIVEMVLHCKSCHDGDGEKDGDGNVNVNGDGDGKGYSELNE